MKKYTRRRQTRSKKYSRRRSRRGGGSRRPKTPAPTPNIRQSSRSIAPPSATPSAIQSSRMKTPSRTPSGRTSSSKSATSKGVVVSRSRGHSHVNASSRAPLRTAGISKKEIKDDAEALQAARLIANFPHNMDKFLEMVINNDELLNYGGVKLALREKISINEDPAVGRLSTNGIIFISYICGKLVCLLNELSTLPKSKVGEKKETLDEIKQIENVICLLDGGGCSWGVRPYNQAEMDAIADYYVKNKGAAGLQEYHQQLNEFIDKYFPVLKKYTDPSHVVSSSMCIRLIPGHVRHVMSTIKEDKED
jgi:hypothetical protein